MWKTPYSLKMSVNCECGRVIPLSRQSNKYSYEEISKIKHFLQSKISIQPEVGIICGSGLDTLADCVQNPLTIDYEDIPDFPVTTAPGHHGKLVFGEISAVPVICMKGRFHYYEGYPLSACAMPIKLMKLLGVTHLIISNAAGGINQTYKAGDIMLIKDHFNIMGLAGTHPLLGFNDPRWGSRFFSMVNAYDGELLQAAKQITKDMGISEQVHEGVYACAGGPSYETIAEIRALKVLGVDAAGMSTAHEVTAARHCDMKCFAFSLITNVCSLEYENPEVICEEDVLNAGELKQKQLATLVEKVVEYIGRTVRLN